MTRSSLRRPAEEWIFHGLLRSGVIALAAILVVSSLAVLSTPGRAASVPRFAQPASAMPGYMHYVRVNDFKFDPLVAGPDIPSSLSYGVLLAGPSYYIVQFNGPVTPSMKAALAATGATLLYYINYNAFIVRADATALQRAAALPTVRWTGVFEPAFKLSPRLSEKYEAQLEASMQRELGGSQDVSLASPALAVTPTGAKSAMAPTGDPLAAAAPRDPASTLAPPSPTAGSSRVNVAVLTFESDNVLDAARALAARGGTSVTYQFAHGGLLRANVSRASLISLARQPGVMWIDLEAQPYLFNDIARWVIQSGDANTFATPVHDHGIYGTGQTVTLGDSGLDYEHPDFADPSHPTPGPDNRKVTDYYIPPGAEGDMQDNGINHGTHTSGTIAGDDGAWHVYDGDPTGSNGTTGPHDGQAFDAKIQMQDISDMSPYVFPSADMHNMFQPAVDRGSFIHSDSWGSSGGYYIPSAAQMDDFIWNNQDFIVTFAAGNPGSSPYGVNPYSVAKNVISVGASENGDRMNNLADFSGRGPAEDGRLKPDVMAPGVGIWSAHGCDPNPPCNDYWRLSGTSMATPTAAGAAALVRQYYMDGWYPTGQKTPANDFTPSAALVKATLINSAVEMNGIGAYINGETLYPNNNEGWGRIELDNALYFAGDTRSSLLHDERTGLDTGKLVSYLLPIADAAQPVDVTLVWSDYPGAPITTPNLVNDLDLTVTAPDGTAYQGNQFIGYNPGESEANPAGSDHLNNVEGVLVRTGVQAGVWTVQVAGVDVPEGPQPFAIIMSGSIAADYGSVLLDQGSYASSATVHVRVADTGLNANPSGIDTAWAWMTSTTETTPENVTLTETGVDTSAFEGSIGLDRSATPIPGDGWLQVQNLDNLTAAYFDANDGLGGSGWRTARAVVDDTPPVISDVAVLSVRFNRATVTWSTDEPSDSTVVYGVGAPPGTSSSMAFRLTSHAVKLSGLAESTTYFMEIRSTDEAGNAAVDDNGSAYYQFTTPPMPPIPPPDTEWPTFHNNEPRLGVSPSDLAPPLQLRWKSGPQLYSGLTGPVLKDGILFSTTWDGYLRARDPYSGGVLWSRYLGDPWYYTGTPAVDQGLVLTTFYGSQGGFVYALDAVNGATRWVDGRAGTGLDFNARAAMAVADGKVFGTAWGGQVYALDEATGSVLWTSQTYGTPLSGPTVAAGLVFEGTMEGQVFAIDEFDGGLVWSTIVTGSLSAPPLYLGGHLFFGTYTGDVGSINTDTGSVYALDAFTGDTIWQATVPGGFYEFSTPATDGSSLFIGMARNYSVRWTSYGAYLALNASDGTVMWTTGVPEFSQSSPAYANGYVYGTSIDGYLWVLRASDGSVAESDWVGNLYSASSPAVSDGWVWVDGGSGVLYAYLGQVPAGLFLEPGAQSRESTPSSTVDYLVSVTNMGASSPDTFDLSVTPGSLGWAVDLFESDGVTPLPDTNGNGVPDTGSVLSNASGTVHIRVTVPAGVSPGDREASEVTFTSSDDATRSKVERLTTEVPPPAVEVEPRGYYPAQPGDTVTSTINVHNLGGFPDIFDVHATSRGGWTVSLFLADGVTPLPDANGDGIPDTGSLAGLTSATIVLRVQVPSNAPMGAIDPTTVIATSARLPSVTGSTSVMVDLAPPRDPEWPQFQQDPQRTGDSPGNFYRPLQFAWSLPPGVGGPQLNAPVIEDHVVYYANPLSGSVRALDLGTGTLLWSAALSSADFYAGTPAVSNGTVYAPFITQESGWGSEATTLFALNSSTGAVLWRASAPAPYFITTHATPAVAQGSVFWFGAQTIYATDARTGSTEWTYTMDGYPSQGPTYWAGMVYAADDAGRVVALDATTGAALWSKDLGVGMDSAPTVAGGTLFIGDWVGSFHALDALTGQERWSAHALGNWITVSSAAVAAGLVFVASFGFDYRARLTALDVDTGALVWSRPTLGGQVWTSPVYSGGYVYLVTTWDTLYSWTAAAGLGGAEFSFNGWADGSPAIADGYLVVGDAGTLRAFSFMGTGTPSGLVAEPSSVTVSVTGAAVLTAWGLDQYGNHVDLARKGFTVHWSDVGGLGSIVPLDATGDQIMYIAGTTPGLDKVYLTVPIAPGISFNANATVTIVAGTPDHVAVTPPSASIAAGGTMQFAATVEDGAGNQIPGLGITWSVSPSLGTISASGLLTAAGAVGTGTVTATYGSLSTSVAVTIMPGPLASILVEPTSVDTVAGATVLLKALGEDVYGNPTDSPLGWSATRGTLTPVTAHGTTVLYVAPTAAGAQTVTVTSGSHTEAITVDVRPGAVAMLSVTPPALNLAPGGTTGLHATATDAYGNPISGGAFVWTVTTGSVQAGSDSSNATFTAGGAGTGVISVTYGGKSATVSITVTPSTILDPQTLQTALVVLIVAVAALAAVSAFLFWKDQRLRRRLDASEHKPTKPGGGGLGGT